MTMHRSDDLTCDAFAATLSAYLEEELDRSARSAVEAHAASCAECGALLADLRGITMAASTLPTMAPSRDLWSGIAARIEAPVVSMTERRDRTRWLRHPALAAAALVFVTAGVTYLATKSTLQRDGAPTAIAARPSAPERPASQSNPSDDAERIGNIARAQARVAITDTQPDLRRTEPRPRPATVERRDVRQVRLDTDAVQAVDSLYGREIARLRWMIGRRAGMLDPATVAVLEQSLGVIDSAIVRSRAALLRDPNSGFLTEQLTSALEKKVELLRTVATLSTRS